MASRKWPRSFPTSHPATILKRISNKLIPVPAARSPWHCGCGMRANFFGVSGYDGMHLIYEAIRKTGGKTDGDSFIGAVKGMSWESPRGPMTIDPETRDVISNIYLRRVERVNGELWNIEFATVENVKDPVKAARK